jgi:glycosyltransferase involved in cell wall biosynthesis
LKILLLNQTFYPDVMATGQHLAELAVALAERGHQVTVVTGRRAYDEPEKLFPARETWRGVRIFRVFSTRFGKRAKWRRAADFASFILFGCARLACLPRQDVVVALTTPPLISFIGAWRAKLWRAKFCYWVMDLNPDEAVAAGWLRADSFMGKMLERMSRFSFRRADRIIALDRFMRDRIAAKGIAPEIIAVLPPWSHDREVRFDAAGREQFRKAHGLQDKFVVMYSGNHSPVHPLDTLMEAAEKLQADASVVFCFVGGGSEFKRVQRWAERPGEVENQTSRAKAGEVSLLEYGIDSTGQAISRASAGEGANQTSQAEVDSGQEAEGEKQGAGIGSTSPRSSPQRGEGGLPSTLNSQPSTGKLSNVLCLPYQPLNQLAASLSAADAHVVVMGEAMLGLVHPCKIYNILAVGAPVIYIGPQPSHVTEILNRLGDEYPAIQVRHGQADLLADQIQSLRQRGSAGQRKLPVETMSAFSQASLLPRLAALIEGAA